MNLTKNYIEYLIREVNKATSKNEHQRARLDRINERLQRLRADVNDLDGRVTDLENQ